MCDFVFLPDFGDWMYPQEFFAERAKDTNFNHSTSNHKTCFNFLILIWFILIRHPNPSQTYQKVNDTVFVAETSGWDRWAGECNF